MKNEILFCALLIVTSLGMVMMSIFLGCFLYVAFCKTVDFSFKRYYNIIIKMRSRVYALDNIFKKA